MEDEGRAEGDRKAAMMEKLRSAGRWDIRPRLAFPDTKRNSVENVLRSPVISEIARLRLDGDDSVSWASIGLFCTYS